MSKQYLEKKVNRNSVLGVCSRAVAKDAASLDKVKVNVLVN